MLNDLHISYMYNLTETFVLLYVFISINKLNMHAINNNAIRNANSENKYTYNKYTYIVA